jgi:6-phospho-3-hexuloisomerase
MQENRIHKRFIDTLSEISEQIQVNSKKIEFTNLNEFLKMILEIDKHKNRIFIYGAGRSGFIGRCFAQRLMHLGLNSCFVSDAVTYQYKKDDLLILISGSGETTSPVAIAKKAKKIGGKIALFTANPASTIGKLSDVVIKIEGKSKDKAVDEKTLAPYTSLYDISTLSILDSIGGILMEILGMTERDIEMRHASIE